MNQLYDYNRKSKNISYQASLSQNTFRKFDSDYSRISSEKTMKKMMKQLNHIKKHDQNDSLEVKESEIMGLNVKLFDPQY